MIELLAAAVAATSTMTIFSYLIALLFRQPYKEPLLLAFLLEQLPAIKGKASKIMAWMLHYGIGLLFVIALYWMLDNDWFDASWQLGIVYGFVIGVIGILGWMVMFRISHHRPQMNYTGYYIQLLFAHVVFALTVIAFYKWHN